MNLDASLELAARMHRARIALRHLDKYDEVTVACSGRYVKYVYIDWESCYHEYVKFGSCMWCHTKKLTKAELVELLACKRFENAKFIVKRDMKVITKLRHGRFVNYITNTVKAKSACFVVAPLHKQLPHDVLFLVVDKYVRQIVNSFIEIRD